MIPLLLVYLPFKAFVYAAWCYVGLRYFMYEEGQSLLKRAQQFGAIRLGIGLLLMIPLAIFSGSVYFHMSEWFLSHGMFPTDAGQMLIPYLFVYAPTRLVEWGLTGYFMMRKAHKPTKGNAALWLLGAIAVSYLTDLPWWLMGIGHMFVGIGPC